MEMSSLQSALTIGALAEQAGCNVPTVRYYEEIGLLPKAVRRASGHRVYGANDLKRLVFVRRCRDFDFPIERIRDLVLMIDKPDSDCTRARDLAEVQLSIVRKKIVELQELEHNLAKFSFDCTENCAGGPSRDCVILGDFAGKAGGCGSRS
jgi:MerR family transcriptional regulator, copper efflux regulator